MQDTIPVPDRTRAIWALLRPFRIQPKNRKNIEYFINGRLFKLTDVFLQL